MIGETVTHYRILEKLGGGGMGVVYRGEDTRLHRPVAVKFLPEGLAQDAEALARFRREAEAASKLNHPHICTVYDVGDHRGHPFLVMELMEGRTLKHEIEGEPLPTERILELGAQIADALDAAHSAGIVHRDIKPANVFITARGEAKVLDFGLAKFTAAPTSGPDDSALTELALTAPGTPVGTTHYMSPEQARGEHLDSRTDLFSLGIVLYEMATGRRPFEGKTAGAISKEILTEAPLPPSRLNPELPAELGRIVGKLLEKNRGLRYQNASDLRSDLERLLRETERARLSAPTVTGPVGPGGAPEQRPRQRATQKPRLALAGLVLAGIALGALWIVRRGGVRDGTDLEVPPDDRQMIVVLPFETVGPAEDDYFAAGLTDEITSRLAGVSGLGVISPNSAVRYQGKEYTTRQVARELGVGYILAGTIRWAQAPAGHARIRITPKLVRTSDDTNLWAGRYTEEIDDIFRVQTEIADRVLSELQITLLTPERAVLHTRPTDNAAAYRLYLRGLHFENRASFGEDPARSAVEMFERAVELDPGFALAWSKLALNRSRLFNYALDRSTENRDRALAAARKALDLRPDLSAAHLALAYYYYWCERDYDRAQREASLAASTPHDPSEVLAIRGFIARRTGDWEVSRAAHEEVLATNPRDPQMLLQLGGTYLRLRQYARATELVDQAIALEPEATVAYQVKAEILIGWRGDAEAAREVLDSAPNQDDVLLSLRSRLELSSSDPEAALRTLDLFQEESYHLGNNLVVPKKLARAWVLDALAQGSTARVVYEEVRRDLERQLPARADDPLVHAALGLTCAGLGLADVAVRHGARAVELLPVSKDALQGMSYVEVLARIHARFGDLEAALRGLEEMLSKPYIFSVEWLELDPVWDPVREHPGYRSLLDRYS